MENVQNMKPDRPPDKVRIRKSFFLFLNQNICCGYSKEPSHPDGSFESPKRRFQMMGKEINTILGEQTILIWTYDLCKVSYFVHFLQFYTFNVNVIGIKF